MSPTLAVLRPEPGNAATIARAAAAGFATLSLPLFEIAPLGWDLPDPAGFDAVILTSANALRFGGAGLGQLRHLPVLAVGPHTADAARAAGFDVIAAGAGAATEIVAAASVRGIRRALHLTGRERTLEPGGPIAEVIPVYASVERAIEPREIELLRGAVALLHSARAAQRLAALVDRAAIERATIAITAFSAAVAAAVGSGWADVAIAERPDDAALFAAIDRRHAAANR